MLSCADRTASRPHMKTSVTPMSGARPREHRRDETVLLLCEGHVVDAGVLG